MKFTSRTAELLQKSGWSDKYSSSIERYKSFLEDQGYLVGSHALSFLTSFGGLRVVHPHEKVPGRTEYFHLDPIEAASGITRERVELYEARVHESLCVIGEAYSEHMVLMMSASGKIYAAYDDLLIRVGDSGIDAIEALCSGHDMEEIP